VKEFAMQPTQKRAGFSIFQLLVVLAILAMLVGFLVPAVQKVREAAARTQLSNNFKQVLLAMHSAHDTNRKLPPATGTYGGLKSNQTISVHLLPYLEQAALYEQIAAGKAPPTKVVIPTYNSPLDFTTTDYVRVQNIAANVRVFTDDGVNTLFDKTVTLKSPMPCESTFGRTFTDGTSNTVVFSSRYAGALNVVIQGESDTPCGFYDLPLANNGGSFFGATPMTDRASATSASGFQLSPTFAQVNCKYAIGMAHSYGRYGIHVGIADGSVRMVSPGISHQTWNMALQPNDGNPLGPDW